MIINNKGASNHHNLNHQYHEHHQSVIDPKPSDTSTIEELNLRNPSKDDKRIRQQKGSSKIADDLENKQEEDLRQMEGQEPPQPNTVYPAKETAATGAEAMETESVEESMGEAGAAAEEQANDAPT